MNNSQPTNAKKPGLLSAVLYFAGVAAVVTAVALAAPSPDDPSVPTTVAEAAPTTTTLAVASPDPADPNSEPVAEAAETILPSVVHIQTPTGLGSGVIYDPDGLIVTAAHVVQGEETVRIRLADGRQFDGTVVGTASDVDVAVIRIDATDLTAAAFETEKPRVGQLAIAVGSPWNLASTVTSGIISAVDRPSCNQQGTCVSVVQTDAAINPGNSGGALVDRSGRVVGINVSIFTETGANDGVGFAVPSETVLAYAKSIVSGEPLVAGFLGVTGGDLMEGGRAGALITEVLPGSAAEEAGIQVEDVVVSIDGVPIQGIEDLAAQVRGHRPGDIVEVVLLRDGEEIVYQVTLGEREESS